MQGQKTFSFLLLRFFPASLALYSLTVNFFFMSTRIQSDRHGVRVPQPELVRATSGDGDEQGQAGPPRRQQLRAPLRYRPVHYRQRMPTAHQRHPDGAQARRSHSLRHGERPRCLPG